MSSQPAHSSAKGDDPTRPARRGVQRRDWAAVAVVAIIAVGLGAYLLARPSGSNTPSTNPVVAAPAAISTSGSAAPDATSTTNSRPSMGAAPPGMGMNPSMMTTGMSPAMTTATSSSGQATSAVLPPVPSDGAQAAKIGPFGDLAHRIAGDPLAQGNINAPVVMVMFSDFRCPFCAEFSRITEPVLVRKYVDTGILRIEWRDFPIFGAQSTAAAIAGRAAAAQGRFFPFAQAVYAVAPQTGHPDLSAAALVGFARKAGVPDIARFTAALDNPAAATAVAADLDQASNLGVPSTPAFIINGYPLVGAQPLAEFTALIDKIRALK